MANLVIKVAFDGFGSSIGNISCGAYISGYTHRIQHRTLTFHIASNLNLILGHEFAPSFVILLFLALHDVSVNSGRLSIVGILTPREFTGLLIGVMLPYIYSTISMKAVISTTLNTV